MNERPAVAIDFDGVLASYDGWKGVEVIGNPIPGARKFMQDLGRVGFWRIIHTVRLGEVNRHEFDKALDAIKAWLKRHEIGYDELWTGMGKPLAVAYVDDRAIEFRPMSDDPGILSEWFDHVVRRAKDHAGFVKEQEGDSHDLS